VLTPDEETPVSGHMDGKIRLWSIATGALAGSMQETPVGDEVDEITALSVSADGALLVSGSIHGVISVVAQLQFQSRAGPECKNHRAAADGRPGAGRDVSHRTD
jgi:WD40 repeat protein